MSNLRHRRRTLRRTRERLGNLKFAGYAYLDRKRDELRAAVSQRIRRLTQRIRRSSQPSHRVIPRSEWGARPPKSKSSMANDNSGVFIHHTVGASPSTEDAEKAEMRAIQRYHMDTKGWSDIGYSFVVAPSGRIYEGRGINVAGAHTVGYNSTAYGLCAMGNYETAQPTAALVASLRWLRRDYLRLSDRPLRPHSAVYSTACPGRNLRARLSDL